MPSTPTYGLPYPALSDSPDVPRDIKALAEVVDGQLNATNNDVTAIDTRVTAIEGEGAFDAAWTDLPLVNGYGPRTGFATAAYRKARGGMVKLTGAVFKTGAANEDVIATLPTGYRPSSIVSIIIGNNSTGNSRIEIDSSGAIKLYFTGTPSTFYIAGEFPIGR